MIGRNSLHVMVDSSDKPKTFFAAPVALACHQCEPLFAWGFGPHDLIGFITATRTRFRLALFSRDRLLICSLSGMHPISIWAKKGSATVSAKSPRK